MRRPASEFQRICRDLAILGDTVTIAVSKDGVKFSVAGEMGSGNMTLRQNSSVDTKEEEQVSIQMEEPVTLKIGETGLLPVARVEVQGLRVLVYDSKENETSAVQVPFQKI